MGASHPGPDDAELMRQWRKGDQSAFEVLVRRWERPVARFLARLVADTDSVADLCQEVFLRVYQAGDRYVESGFFTTWLYRIALNLARDAARRRRNQPAPLSDHDPVDMPFPNSAAGERGEIAAAVMRAIIDLPLPLREVVVLRHYEGMRFEAISRLTGIPASTLKSRFAAALARLRIALRAFAATSEESEP